MLHSAPSDEGAGRPWYLREVLERARAELERAEILLAELHAELGRAAELLAQLRPPPLG